MIKEIPDRLGHDKAYALNCNKMMEQFSWHPRRRFEFQIGEVVNWYKKNILWWQPLVNKK